MFILNHIKKELFEYFSVSLALHLNHWFVLLTLESLFYIVHFHVKDGIFDARKLDIKLCPPGKGNVKYYPEIIKSLMDNGYEGVFSIESEYAPKGGTPEDGFRECAKGFKEILKNLSLD